jgi:prepilin-type N-terminal cleavage/methylation domain-containing protein
MRMIEKRNFRRDSGFSMVELLFALVILAVGLLGIIQLQVSAMANLAKARHQTTAMELVERKMEFLKSLPILPQDVDNPTAPVLDAFGAPIVDASGAGGGQDSVLYDAISMVSVPGVGMQGEGDGRATLHWDLPVDENGRPLRRDQPEVGRMGYLVMWTIERGGARGTPWPAGLMPHPANVPTCIPGPNQMRIRVIVAWFEPYDKERGETIQGFDFTAYPKEYPAFNPDLDPRMRDLTHKWLVEFLPNSVELECIRDIIF